MTCVRRSYLNGSKISIGDINDNDPRFSKFSRYTLYITPSVVIPVWIEFLNGEASPDALLPKLLPSIITNYYVIYSDNYMITFCLLLRERFPQLLNEVKLGDLFGPEFRKLINPNNPDFCNRILRQLHDHKFDLNKVVQLYLIDPTMFRSDIFDLIVKYKPYQYGVNYIIDNPVNEKLPTGNYGVNPDTVKERKEPFNFYADEYNYVISNNTSIIRSPHMEKIVTICDNLSKYARISLTKGLIPKSEIKDELNKLMDYIIKMNEIMPLTKNLNLVSNPYSPVERAINRNLNPNPNEIPVKLPVDILYIIMGAVESPFDIYSVGEFVPTDKEAVTKFVKHFCPIFNINYDKLYEFIKEGSSYNVDMILHYLNFDDYDGFPNTSYESILIDPGKRQKYRDDIKEKIDNKVDSNIISHDVNMHLLDVSLIIILAASILSDRITEDQQI